MKALTNNDFCLIHILYNLLPLTPTILPGCTNTPAFFSVCTYSLGKKNRYSDCVKIRYMPKSQLSYRYWDSSFLLPRSWKKSWFIPIFHSENCFLISYFSFNQLPIFLEFARTFLLKTLPFCWKFCWKVTWWGKTTNVFYKSNFMKDYTKTRFSTVFQEKKKKRFIFKYWHQ